MEAIFKRADGTPVENLVQYVSDWIDKHPDSEIYIGCDSQEASVGTVSYATCICLYNHGKGGHVITKKESFKINKDMGQKLWKEVELAVEVGNELKALDKKITIHIDYNSDPHHKSNKYFEAGLGYAKSLGYEAEGKPNAFTASYVSDKQCRPSKKPRRVKGKKQKNDLV